MKTLKLFCFLLATGSVVLGSPISSASSVGQSHSNVPSYDERPSQSMTLARASADQNWSGAIVRDLPDGEHFTTINGTFTVPYPKPPSSSGYETWSGAAWVGIDGQESQNFLLQGGIEWRVTRETSGELSYYHGIWIEWFPAPIERPSDMNISPGDSVSVTCTAHTSVNGSCSYINHSTGDSTTLYVNAPSSENALKGVTAEWIVEDLKVHDEYAPFADYGSEAISDCSAGTNGGSTVDLSNAVIEDIVQDGHTYSQCSLDSSSSISCHYA